jgi:MoxR-like ATPase
VTPAELKNYLSNLLRHNLKMSVMLWGPPGIGKSSVVAQIAKDNGFDLVDLRLSQLAPTDLRGLPVPDNGISRWYPPEFLPRQGKGILFLDELNMAPPTLQGIAQQLILDRKVGSYVVPDGWFIWAAGNRKEDRASVFDMPAPLANRFLHLEVLPDFESWRVYALENDLSEQVLAFLSYRPTLLHKIDPQRPGWPSPRSWEMGSRLFTASLDIAPAVGEGAAAEFSAFVALYRNLPDLDAVLAGKGKNITFPDEPSIRYATTVGLSMRPKTTDEALNSFRWLVERAGAEWVQLFGNNLMVQMRARNLQGMLAIAIQKEPQLRKFLTDYQNLLGLSGGVSQQK